MMVEPSAPHDPKISSHDVQVSSLVKRVNRVLATRYEDRELPRAFSALGDNFGSENTLEERAALKRATRKQYIDNFHAFIQSFTPVEGSLHELSNEIESLENACQTANNELEWCHHATRAVLEKAQKLRRERADLQEKKFLCSAFLAKLQVSESALDTLTAPGGDITPEFFKSLEEVERIQANIANITAAGSKPKEGSPKDDLSNISMGTDELQVIAEIAEEAYERLFVWVQCQCRAMATSLETQTGEGAPLEVQAHVATNFWMDESEEGQCLGRALHVLKARPVYLQQCSKDIARLRQHLLVQSFYSALSKGGPNGNPRPIEMHAYDPYRYVGDMLAWIHQSATTEKEFGMTFRQLTTVDQGGSRYSYEGTLSPLTATPNEEAAPVIDINVMLDSIFEGLIPPFRMRVEQVLTQANSAVTLYKVMQLLEFFAMTLEPLMRVAPLSQAVGPDSSESEMKQHSPIFVTACLELRDGALTTFRELWDAQGLRLGQLPSHAVVSSDFSAPQFVVEAVQQLTEVMEVFNSAIVTSSASKDEEFAWILDSALNPVVNFCRQSAHRLPTEDAPVYLINCFAHMQSALTKRDFTAMRVQLFATLLDEQINILVECQAETVLAKLGISERLKALKIENEAGRYGDQMTAPCLHPLSLSACFRSFYTSLFTMGSLSLPQIEKISSRNMRSEARYGLARALAGAYEELYNGTEALGVATHSPDQIKTLLDV